MNRAFCRLALLLLGGATGVVPLSHAAGHARATDVQELSPELQALLAEVQPAWTASGSVSVATGYKDNLLLSRTDPASSGFTRAGFEALLWHVPRGKTDYYAFFNGDYTRYFKRTTDQFQTAVDHEAEAFGGVEWRFRQPGLVNISLDAQGYYLDQVFDISDPSVTRSIAALKVLGLKGGPTVRWFVFHGLWIEGNATYDRQNFQDGLNDARIREATGRLGWTLNDRVEFSFAGTERRRDFDQRLRVAPGISLRGLLVTHEREAEGRNDVTWGRSRHWTTRTRAGVRRYEDNGVGFLNFHDRHVAEDIIWTAGKWRVEVEAEVRRRQYDNQFAEGGSSPPPIVKNETTAALQVERTVSKHWTIFAEIDDERSRSNDEIASYRMKEGLLGARWSWEK